ncbi:MAG: 3-dehydroquinate synthase [Peptococcaceae bacterium]
MENSAKVQIKLPFKKYDIIIGANILNDFGKNLRRLLTGGQVVLVSNEPVYSFYGKQVENSLLSEGFAVIKHILPDGEEYKTWGNAGGILTSMLEEGLNRDSVVVALGGGVIGDIAGFAAAIYQRGVCFAQIPTTLLAQVDSSVGGKVAVNHPLGKNMIGSFYQPVIVWSDLNTLHTLPEREWIAGLAEVIKYGVIWDEDFFNTLEKNAVLLKKRDQEFSKYIIRRSCEIKGEIVSQDEKDEGIRNILNLGHTIGHALEKVTDYKVLRHGEGVAIGMVAAGDLAVNLNKCSPVVLERIKNLFISVGLPVSISAVSTSSVMESLYLDKKIKDKQLVFILPQKIGKVAIIKGLTQEEILKSLEAVIKN